MEKSPIVDYYIHQIIQQIYRSLFQHCQLLPDKFSSISECLMLVKLYQTGFITCPEMRSLCKTYVNMIVYQK